MVKPKTILIISSEDVEITERALLESSLPDGYHLGGRMGMSYSILTNCENRFVGVVRLENDKLDFKAEDDNSGAWFERRLEEKYPGKFSARLDLQFGNFQVGI